MLPEGIIGSNEPKIEVMWRLTESSRTRSRVVAWFGENARKLGASAYLAYRDPENGEQMATSLAIRGVAGVASIAYFPISPPLLCATMAVSRRPCSATYALTICAACSTGRRL